LSTGRSEPLQLDGLPWPLVLSVHPRARRLTLRLDSKGHRLKLTCPRHVSRRRALEWALSQRDWVVDQVGKQGAALSLAPGTTIPFDGAPHVLESRPDGPRRVETVAGVIRVGGPEDGFAGRLGRWLRAESRRRLTDETMALADAHGIEVTSVQVGDAGTRWGSCSHDGRIRFSWRLLLAPPEVRRYVVAHELAHRLHMDHSPAFRAAEKRIFGRDPASERLALRRLSADLRRIRLA
jgi:predicted metal-dependent hydrolase